MEKFEPRKTFEHIDKLSYGIGPRLAGSERSDQASEYIKSKFGEYGLDTDVQEFDFFDRLKETRAIMVVLVAIFFSSFALNLFLNPIITLGIALFGVSIFIYFSSDLMSEKKESNVIGRLKGSDEPEKKIVLGAHYDTDWCVKNWKWPMLHKIFLPVVIAAFFLILVLPILGVDVWILSWAVLAVPFLAVVTIPFWSYEDLISPGAEDNSSGISVLLEMARVISESDVDDAEIEFVAFGAEEQGLSGSRAYAEEVDDVDLFLNLDSVGSGDRLCVIEGNGVLRKRESSKDLRGKIVSEIEGGEVWSAFSSHDHLPFLSSGISSTTLTSRNMGVENRLDAFLESIFGLSNVRTDRLYQIHTIDDVPEEIELENLEKVGEVLFSVLPFDE